MGFAEDLAADLRQLGIRAGDVLLVHTSIKGLRAPGLSPEDVIGGLLQALTQEGTLLVPALSYSTVTREHPSFRVRDTPACIGAVPECFRTRYAEYRSVHPTHSVCAVGKRAKEITERHRQDTTPVGPNSPFMQLPAWNGKILMLGCGLRPNTFMHGVEEYASAPYPLAETPICYTIFDGEGAPRPKEYVPHEFGRIEQRYDRLAEVLSAPDLTEGRVLGGTAYLIDAAAALAAASAKMRAEPYYFVDIPEGGK